MEKTKELIHFFCRYVTEHKWELFKQNIEQRTKYLTVVLENIYHSQNASAVLRTCDCLGIQDVHIIENTNEYKLNPYVVLGSSKWINMIKYNETTNNTLNSIEKLKNSGYRIVATIPKVNGTCLQDFDLSKGKTALFFGTEEKGLSEDVIKNSDEFLNIEMVGFTESFNISVSAGVILYTLLSKLRKSAINWKLTESEKDETILLWLKNSIKHSEELEQYFYKNNINY